MDKKLEIALRLKDFVGKNFSSTAEFARSIGKERTFFTPYMAGKSILGGEILSKLAELGCDINWLLTGKALENTSTTITVRDINAKYGSSKVVQHDESVNTSEEGLYERLYKQQEDIIWLLKEKLANYEKQSSKVAD